MVRVEGRGVVNRAGSENEGLFLAAKTSWFGWSPPSGDCAPRGKYIYILKTAGLATLTSILATTLRRKFRQNPPTVFYARAVALVSGPEKHLFAQLTPRSKRRISIVRWQTD